jgi:hypothetical protein
VCHVHIQTLEKIGPTYARAVKYRAIGKQVLITKSSLKGIIGYAVAHNYVLNDFLVDLVSRSKIRLHANHLVYLLVYRFLILLIGLIRFTETAVKASMRALRSLPLNLHLHLVSVLLSQMDHSSHPMTQIMKHGISAPEMSPELTMIGEWGHQVCLSLINCCLR